jgi:cytochrome c peroxidase
MKTTTITSIIIVTLLMVFGAACVKSPSESATIDPAKLKMFKPVADVVAPKDGTLTEEKVALGRMLYYDTRLSKSQKISCNSCHNLAKYGVDGEPTSDGHKGQKGDRNSPTVYHAAGQFVQFWDGRAKDVEEQAKGPVLNPVEMAMVSDKAVVATLKSMPEYVAAFKKAFPNAKDPVTYDNVGKAIGAFERKLVTPSRWDKFLKGDETALTAGEKAGFNAFASAGCATCHAGTYLGGNMFQKAGLVKAWPRARPTG